MFDMSQMQKLQSQMQEKLEKAQEELNHEFLEGKAGGGAVTVTCNGNQEIESVKIKKGIVDLDDEDLEMLEDLFVAAASQALEASKAISQEKLAPLTGGLKIPGLGL